MENKDIRTVLTDLIAEHISSLNRLNKLLKNLDKESKAPVVTAKVNPDTTEQPTKAFEPPTVGCLGKGVNVGKTYSISEASDVLGVPRKVLTAYLVSRKYYIYNQGLRRNMPVPALRTSPLMYASVQKDRYGNEHTWWKFTWHGLEWLKTEVFNNPSVFGKYNKDTTVQPTLI